LAAALGAAFGKTAGAAAGYDAPRGRCGVGDFVNAFLSAALEATPQTSKEEKVADRGRGGYGHGVLLCLLLMVH